MLIRRSILCLAIALSACGTPVEALPGAAVEAAFSPGGGAEHLVLTTIDGAHRSIRLAAYSFTSPPVVRALLAARRRGVDVAVVVDEKSNRAGAGAAAVQLLVQAGVPTRTNGRYAIHHDKFIVADGNTVQTGSFNYSRSAAERNSENVLVVRGNPALASQYLRHWQSRWDGGVDAGARY